MKNEERSEDQTYDFDGFLKAVTEAKLTEGAEKSTAHSSSVSIRLDRIERALGEG